MLIRSLRETYTIVEEYPEKTPGVREFQGLSSQGKKTYLVCIPDAQSKTLYEQLEQIRKKGHFEDLLEYFFAEGSLNVVFFKPTDPSLAQKLAQEKLSLLERLTVLKGVLERLLLLDAPPCFLKGTLTAARICVSPSLAVSFDYDCADILQLSEYQSKDVAAAFAGLCRTVFAQELQLKEMPELEAFCKTAQTTGMQSYMALYQAFYPVYFQYCDKTEKQLKPDGFQARLHKKLAWLWSKKRTIIGAIVMILAILYLGAAIWARLTPDERQPYFSNIGTRAFEEPADEEQTDQEATEEAGA